MRHKHRQVNASLQHTIQGRSNISRQLFAFPLASAVNFFSTTFLLILAGLSGKEELAADIAIAQGAILAVFMSMSGNARSLILSDQTHQSESELFYFRLFLLLPAAAIAFYLARIVIDLPLSLLLGLILRKSLEWLIDILLASREKHTDITYAGNYLLVNAIGLFILSIQIIFMEESSFHYAFWVWALSPCWALLSYLSQYRYQWTIVGYAQFVKYIPHVGSSAIIGMTTYILRILLVILVGKIIAGQLFTAFAIGGIVSAFYTYALGPTLVLQNSITTRVKVIIYAGIFVLLGGVVYLNTEGAIFRSYSPYFVEMIAVSIMGGGIMLVAQHIRLRILQGYKEDVFVPDALANILFLSSIPFIFHLLGEKALIFLFLWSSGLNFIFYFVLYSKQRLSYQ